MGQQEIRARFLLPVNIANSNRFKIIIFFFLFLSLIHSLVVCFCRFFFWFLARSECLFSIFFSSFDSFSSTSTVVHFARLFINGTRTQAHVIRSQKSLRLGYRHNSSRFLLFACSFLFFFFLFASSHLAFTCFRMK